MVVPQWLRAVRPGLARYRSDLIASRAFVAGEVTHARWLNLGHFSWRDIAPGRAVRTALGVMVPLILGFALGKPEYGTFAALGALPAGFVSFRGVTRTRVLLVAVTAAGMAVATFAGAATADGPSWMLIPLIVVWAYVAGVLAALGPGAIAVSLQWPIALLIGSAIPLSPASAAVRGALVLAGGLWQGALVVMSWALSRGSAERTAMADSYDVLSKYAAQLAAGRSAPPPADVLPGTDVLRDPNPLLRSSARQHLIDLMEEAERIRTTLTVLAATQPDPTKPKSGPEARRIALLRATAHVLVEIAAALRTRPAHRDHHLGLAETGLDPRAAPPGQAWGWAAAALAGQLRSAARITARLNAAEPASSAGPHHPSLRLPTRDLLVTLEASLGPSSEAGRHAIRLAVISGLAEVIALAARLPHGYWVPLTVLIVLRPEYGSTLYRGLQRAAGTVLGAGLGLATVQLGHLGSTALLVGIGVTLFAAYAIFPVNYLFYAVFVTEFVVVLLALAGLPAEQTAVDRLIGTGIGTGLALLAYILWPTWERTGASDKFAAVILAQSRFADLLLRAYCCPASDEARRARSLKLTARRARLEAEASADRLADEPDRPPMTRALGQALVSTGHRMALSTLALEAAVGAHHAALDQAALDQAAELTTVGGGPANPARPADAAIQPPLDQLAGMVRQASTQLAEALHRRGPPGPLPPLREVQSAIPPDDHHPDESAALFAATDGLVDTLNTAAEILRRHLAARRANTKKALSTKKH